VAVTTPPGTGAALTPFTVTTPVDAVSEGTGLRLLAPWPNPARGAVELGFTLTEPAPVQLGVYTVSGARVAQLASGVHRAGTQLLIWDGCDMQGRPVAAGVYLVRLQTNTQSLIRRIVRVK